MAEWLALQTGKRGDSGSIPAKVKTFFFSINQQQNYHFESNLNLKLNFFLIEFVLTHGSTHFIVINSFQMFISPINYLYKYKYFTANVN